MESMTLLILLIAAYAAILATILAIRELRVRRRRIVICLDRLDRPDKKQVCLTNNGREPITLIDMAIDVPLGPIAPAEMAEGKWPFPVTLAEGDSLTFTLSQLANRTIDFHDQRLEVSVYDSAGHEFTQFSRRIFH